jgi:hypothetical protein
MGSSLAQATDGTTYLSWLEPAGGERWALKFSRFDGTLGRWEAARTIASGADWFVNWADFPVLAADGERLTAVWYVNNAAAGGHGHHSETYHAVHSRSADGGATWSAPEPITRESDSVEFVALQPLPDGRLLAAWLDGRARAAGVDRQTLHARVLGTPGPDTLVDGFVCDCCQLSFVPAPGGGALLAYRGRTPDEIRDLQLARFDGQTWQRPATLHADGWKIAGCPVNGPAVDTRGERTAIAWFTAADGVARVQAKLSRDSGLTFGPALPIDLGRPIGRLDLVMLADGSAVVSWLEASTGQNAAGLYVRRLFADGHLSDPHLLVATSAVRASGFARMAARSGADLPIVISWTEAAPTDSKSPTATRVCTAEFSGAALARPGAVPDRPPANRPLAVVRAKQIEFLELCTPLASNR